MQRFLALTCMALLLPIAPLTAVVDIAVVPASQTVQVGQVFALDIYIHANGQAVDTVDADMTFDPSYLEVQSITGDIYSGLPDEFYSVFDNLLGRLTHSRAILSGQPPTDTFRLCSISFRAKAIISQTTVSFTDATGVYSEGLNVLQSRLDGSVTIEGGAMTTPTPTASTEPLPSGTSSPTQAATAASTGTPIEYRAFLPIVEVGEETAIVR